MSAGLALGQSLFLVSTMVPPAVRRSARKERHRFRYSGHSRSGFIELENDRFTPEDLRQKLVGVAGVTYVVPPSPVKDGAGQPFVWSCTRAYLEGVVRNSPSAALW